MRTIRTSELILLVIAVLLITALLYLPGLGLLTLIHEEPRRALVALEMREHGNFLVPHLLGEVYLSKPPMYNWLLVISSHLFGTLDEFSARITSVFSMMLLSLFSAIVLRRHLSRVALIFFSFSLLFVPEFANKARLAEIEVLFALLASLSIWTWYDRYESGIRSVRLWILPSFLVGLAFLTKREPAVAFYYLSVLGWLVYRRNLGLLFSPGHILGFLILTLVGGSWLYAVVQEVGLQGFMNNSQEEVFQRNLGADALASVVHAIKYPLDILLACFPFSLVLIGLFNRSIRQVVIEEYPSLFYFCVIVILINLPLYLFRVDVAVRYYLPLFPMLMVLVSITLDALVADRINNFEQFKSISWLARLLFALCCLVCVALAVSAFFYTDLYTSVNILSSSVVFFVSLFFLLVSVLFKLKFSNNPTFILIFSLFIFGSLFHFFYYSHHLPRELEKHRTYRNMAKLVREIDNRVPNKMFPIQSLGVVPYDIWFYLGFNERLINGDNDPMLGQHFLGFKEQVNVSHFSYERVLELPYRDQTILLVKRVQ